MILLQAAWVFTGIQSPFLAACFYFPIRRFAPRLASPLPVFALVILVSVFWFLEFPFADYLHFLIAGGVLLLCYSFLVFRLRYQNVDSLVLSVLVLIALDELWQTPFNALNWTHSIIFAEVGLATAGWNLMAIPLVLAFLFHAAGRIRFGRTGKALLIISLVLTVFEIYRFAVGGYPDNSSPTPYLELEPYYLVLPWLLTFLHLFQSSSAKVFGKLELAVEDEGSRSVAEGGPAPAGA